MKKIVLLSLLFSLFPSAQLAADGPDNKPNVLLLIIDDMRVDLDRFYSEGAKTPQLDKLAQQGISFNNVYTNAPVCGASRASFLTGLRPTSSRFLNYYTSASEDAPEAITLPQAFRQQGYTTHSIGKVFHHVTDAPQSWSIPAWNPNDNGQKRSPTWRNYVTEERLAMEAAEQASAFESAEVDDGAYYDGQNAERAIAFLKQQKQNPQPFFLAVGFVKPHLPYNAPKKYWDLFDSSKIQLTDIAPAKDAPQAAWHNIGEIRDYHEIPPSPAVINADTSRQLIHGYLASLAYADAQLGRVLEALKDQGLDDNTIVVFMSDHGYALGEHELWVKHSTFNVALRVPLLFRAPGLATGETRQGLAEYLDVYPTLIDLAGLGAPAGQLQGSSLLPRLKDGELPGKPSVYPRWKNADSIRTGDYLYTEWLDEDANIYARMLYDHSKDPDERINVAEDPHYQSVVQMLSTQLAAVRSSQK